MAITALHRDPLSQISPHFCSVSPSVPFHLSCHHRSHPSGAEREHGKLKGTWGVVIVRRHHAAGACCSSPLHWGGASIERGGMGGDGRGGCGRVLYFRDPGTARGVSYTSTLCIRDPMYICMETFLDLFLSWLKLAARIRQLSVSGYICNSKDAGIYPTKSSALSLSMRRVRITLP